jgi:alpha-galactosidase
MIDEMLVAQSKWLPQYARAMDGARKRLASAPARSSEREGAATRPVRSAQELRAAREKKRSANTTDDAASVEVS